MAGQNLPKERPKLTSQMPVLLVGGGEVAEGDIAQAKAIAPQTVAVDGGAAAVLAAGAVPDAVIGDFDSFDAVARDRIPADRLHPIAEQETTDFDKALRSVGAPLVLALGMTGGRIDHELAAYHVLAKRVGPPCIILGAVDLVFLAPPRLTLDVPAETRVSLFPMGPVTGQATGLRWPIAGLRFDPSRVIGTSNAAVASPVTLSFDAPAMLVILPRSTLSVVVAALLAPGCPRWDDV